MHSNPDKIREILKEHLIDMDGEHIPDLVSALNEYADEIGEDRYQDGFSENAKQEEEIRAEVEGDVRDEIVTDLAHYVRAAKSDPQSAAVYFHRATGKHLFEVDQPCLL